MTRFSRLAWSSLVLTVFVIIWGAVVRATGSGAGCGSDWPTCNGDLLPVDGATETVIEFTHRATSGLLVLLIAYLAITAYRMFPSGSRLRVAATATLALVIVESLIGAGLVVFEQTSDYSGVSRGLWQGGHFANTLLLLGAGTLLAWWSGADGAQPVAWREGSEEARRLALAGLTFLFVIGVSGAIAALGDTLFPVDSFGEGLERELSGTAHLFERLRVVHPVLAVVLGLGAGWIALKLGRDGDRRSDLLARRLWSLVLLQIGLGAINVALAAPIWMQVVHLAVADVMWIGFVILTAERVVAAPVLTEVT